MRPLATDGNFMVTGADGHGGPDDETGSGSRVAVDCWGASTATGPASGTRDGPLSIYTGE